MSEKQLSDRSSSSNSNESTAAVGSVIAGRYRLTRLIGEGGMGAVYEAEHVEIGKRIAVKLVRAIHARHREVAERFRREARSASAIESDHIVQVFDAGTDPELGLYMAMELLRGEDLGSLLARTGRIDPETACSVVLQAASALDKAHAANIVHRDLKPANIFLVQREDQTAMVKLVDFGIAKIVRDESTGGGGGLTRMGSAIGTPNYMSPEQAQGLTTLDHRTDIYSLGAVLYEMVVGETPFPEKPTYEQTILQLLTKPVPRALESSPEIPPALDQLIFDMMNADPAQRIGQMKGVRDQILAIYPGLEKARLRLMPKAQVSSGMTALRVSGRPASSAVLGAATQPMRAGGVTLARPHTNVAVTYDPRIADMALGSLSPAGVPRKTKIPWAALGAIVGLGAVVAAAVMLRSQAKPAASAEVGLVTSVVPASAPASPTIAAVPPQLAAPAPAAAAPAVSHANAAEPAPSSAPPKAPSAKVAGGPAAASRSVAKSAQAPAKETPQKPSDQVGGVGISSEF